MRGAGGKQALRSQTEEEEGEQGSCPPPGLEGAGQLRSFVGEGEEVGRQGQRERSWKVEEHRSPEKPRSPRVPG